MLSRMCKFLGLGNLGIGIGLDVVGDAVSREAEINTCISVQLECPANSLGGLADLDAQFRGKILRRSMENTATLLVVRVVLDFLGCDRPGPRRQMPELELPDGQNAQPVVAENPDIEFTTL